MILETLNILAVYCFQMSVCKKNPPKKTFANDHTVLLMFKEHSNLFEISVVFSCKSLIMLIKHWCATKCNIMIRKPISLHTFLSLCPGTVLLFISTQRSSTIWKVLYLLYLHPCVFIIIFLLTLWHMARSHITGFWTAGSVKSTQAKDLRCGTHARQVNRGSLRPVYLLVHCPTLRL